MLASLHDDDDDDDDDDDGDDLKPMRGMRKRAE